LAHFLVYKSILLSVTVVNFENYLSLDFLLVNVMSRAGQ